MNMFIFTRLMGLFWLFAEGMIMLLVRKGCLHIQTGDSRQRGLNVFCAAVFIAALMLTFGEEMRLIHFFGLKKMYSSPFYYRYLWNFMCTLWVLIEGAAAFYIYRAFKTIKNASDKREEKTGSMGQYGLFIFLLCFFFLYAAYHLYLDSLIGRAGLNHQSITRIFLFYIKICGIFWILIEWMIAVMIYKIFILTQRMSS